jgi:cytochrome c peroxidase
MQSALFVRAAVIVCAVVPALAIAAQAPAAGTAPNMFGFADPTGLVRTYNANGAIDLDNPFFQSLGTNGRSCGSCHQPADGWTIVPSHVQARFEASAARTPSFGPTTDPTRRRRMFRPSRQNAPRIACC